jgi:hypothetical protein
VRLFALLLLGGLVLAGCGGGGDATAPETAAPRDVKELANVLDLRSDFERDAGKTRLVVLFSPT